METNNSPHRGKEGLSLGATLLAGGISLVAVLCCLGIPAMLSFMGAVGLGILVKKHLLFPLMVGSLLLGGWGAFMSYRRGKNLFLLGAYLLSALALPLGMKFYHPAMDAGLVGLLLLTGRDLWRRMSAFRPGASCERGSS
ncbi:MAG: MerC domain-containing protein [Leptospirillia bacterium]